MIISVKYKFIFIHVPKTGGLSVDKTIIKHLGPEDMYTNKRYKNPRHTNSRYVIGNFHTDLKKINNLYEDKYKDYYKFAFVRNPYARMVSLYSFHSQLWDHKPENDIESFRGWLMEEDININPHLSIEAQNRWRVKPQIDYLVDENNNIGVDFIGRTEKFQDDLISVLKHVGLETETIPHENKSQHLHYSLYYNEETKEKIKRDFIKDFEVFNYDFETIC